MLATMRKGKTWEQVASSPEKYVLSIETDCPKEASKDPNITGISLKAKVVDGLLRDFVEFKKREQLEARAEAWDDDEKVRLTTAELEEKMKKRHEDLFQLHGLGFVTFIGDLRAVVLSALNPAARAFLEALKEPQVEGGEGSTP